MTNRTTANSQRASQDAHNAAAAAARQQSQGEVPTTGDAQRQDQTTLPAAADVPANQGAPLTARNDQTTPNTGLVGSNTATSTRSQVLNNEQITAALGNLQDTLNTLLQGITAAQQAPTLEGAIPIERATLGQFVRNPQRRSPPRRSRIGSTQRDNIRTSAGARREQARDAREEDLRSRLSRSQDLRDRLPRREDGNQAD